MNVVITCTNSIKFDKNLVVRAEGVHGGEEIFHGLLLRVHRVLVGDLLVSLRHVVVHVADHREPVVSHFDEVVISRSDQKEVKETELQTYIL